MGNKEIIIELFDDDDIRVLRELLENKFEIVGALPIELKTASEAGIGVEVYGNYNKITTRKLL